ncbi:hypothetical protein [Hymenobacter chitinivorans]|uniref:GTPase n=1 Tax=Hymenobacter chitinivorans DSM 11115 TaxID=1121954 RepID=A0A2M9BRP7_9BACT|nr:hypothetical protein [Hymenobacter chitinivorans]PJJ60608.1 hypothetical protein CLV45_2037 [Hymenobacter chitinivorans DSM 11115]
MPQLLFVYNADTGLVNGLLDLAHKLVSPATYPCSLCAITHGTRMRPEWKEFVASLPLESAFLHRDEFLVQYPERAATALPAVFVRNKSGGLTSFITAAELNQADLPGLMQLIQQRLATVG